MHTAASSIVLVRFSSAAILMFTDTTSLKMSYEFGEVYDRFYRTLLVQNILQHAKRNTEENSGSRGTRRQNSERPPSNQKPTWHTFLDSLSVLCDHKHGGETTTAIAVQWNPGSQSSVTFWVSVNQQRPNSTVAANARNHLQYLLQTLECATHQAEPDKETALDMFHTSVDRAKDKVNNYRKKLQGRVTYIKISEGGLSDEGRRQTPLYA